MRMLRITEPYQIEYSEAPDPLDPHSEDVLLQVRQVGICGSDRNTYQGRNPLAQLPRIPGHEVAAQVVKTGSDVPANIQTGQLVTIHPYTNCNQCVACRKGRPNTCEFNQTMGVQRDGAMREYITLDWRKLYFDPQDRLTCQQLVLVEPLSVGFHAIDRGHVSSGDVVAIFGCGAVGMGAIAGALARNATVIAVGRTEHKLAVARGLGAQFTINTSCEQLSSALELIAPNGPDIIIEASGGADAFLSAVKLIPYAGKIVCVGYCPNQVELSTIPFVKKELDLFGSRNALASDFQGVMRQISLGHLPIDELQCQVFDWHNAQNAFGSTESDNVAYFKCIIQVSF